MTEKRSRLLLIVDPQIDFISGSLPVPGAESAMNELASYVEEHGEDYTLICVTCDRHPLCHSSFSSIGGEWPTHCIESSVGAAVWSPLMVALEKHYELVHFLYKGESQDRDEYSIFQSVKGAADMDNHIKDFGIEEIDICGLAGDVCVANTLRDAQRLYPKIHFYILSDFTASLDSGSLLCSIAKSLI